MATVVDEAERRKIEIISGPLRARRRILAAVSSLPAGRHDKAFIGVWWAEDLITHLVGGDYTILQATPRIPAGAAPSCCDPHDRSWPALSEGLATRRCAQDVAGPASAVVYSDGEYVQAPS